MWCFSDFSRVRKAKLAICWYFFVIGFSFGNLAAILPSIKESYDISNGVLGGILAAAVGGALLSLPVVTYCNKTFGSGNSTILGSMFLILLYPIIGIPHTNIGVLILGLFCLGFGAGWSDVSANGQAVLCEKMTRTPILGMFHGLYALGGLSGALLGGIVLYNGISVFHEIVFFSFLLILPGLIVAFWLFSQQEEKLINQSSLIPYQQLGSSDHPTLQQNVHSLLHGGEEQLERQFTGNTLNSTANNYNHSDVDGHLFQSVDRVSTLDSQRDKESNTSAANSRAGSGSHHNTIASLFSSSNPYFRPNLSAEQSLTDSQQTDWQVYTKNSIDGVVDYVALFKLCILCFIAYLVEGSIGDWSAVYLKHDVNSNALECTLGYVGFQLFVALGRFFSDYLVMHIGRKRLLQYCGILGFLGLLIVVIASEAMESGDYTESTGESIALAFSVIGFTLCGAGLSVVAPSVISMAGAGVRGMTPVGSVAYVSSIGYVGWMVGPPLLGGVSMLVGGLRWSFLFDAVLLLAVTVIASFTEDVPQQRNDSVNSNSRKVESTDSSASRKGLISA